MKFNYKIINILFAWIIKYIIVLFKNIKNIDILWLKFRLNIEIIMKKNNKNSIKVILVTKDIIKVIINWIRYLIKIIFLRSRIVV